MIAALVPAIAIATVDEATTDSLTRIGGEPVMAADIAWPKPDPSMDGVDFSIYGEDIVAHVRRSIPLAFVGQVDLAQLPADTEIGNDLPTSGRLLFFYDFLAGAYANGSGFSKVIWDQSLAADATERSTPTSITEADKAFAEATRAAFKSYDLEVTEDDLRSPLMAPLRMGAAEKRLQVPSFFTLESQANTVLSARFENDTDAEDAYRDLPYSETSEDLPVFRLLGLPDPEQDDPRFDAVVVTEFGTQFLSSDAWATNKDDIFRRAAEWRLLAEVDYAGWHDSNGEGTVYFLIRVEDLAARRFDRVVTVYQQT